jgi:CheY-like chemotaxis protein
MGGKIELQSSNGKGSKFLFSLPALSFSSKDLDRADREEELSETGRTFLPKDSLHILIVDDNEISLRLAKCLLQKYDFICTLARGGLEAIDTLRELRFDAILMDCQMPGIDGFVTTSTIRKFEKSKGIYTPIIGLTALAMRGDRERCLEAGMDDYICKPIVIDDLLEVVSRVTQNITAGQNTEPIPTDNRIHPQQRLITKNRSLTN